MAWLKVVFRRRVPRPISRPARMKRGGVKGEVVKLMGWLRMYVWNSRGVV